MSIATDISNRFWNLPQKANEEITREKNYIDDIIQKTHIERLLLENLDGVKTAFDGGAGYGRFSIPLASKGIHVTHFDISQPMLNKAKELAKKQGVASNMTFIHGSLDELGAFQDNQFDLVMSFDSPISYTYPKQETVIQELVRIANKKICIGVYSRLAWTYHFDPAQKEKYILDKDSNDWLVRWTLDNGLPNRAEHRPSIDEVWEFYKSGLMEPVNKTAEVFQDGGTPWPVSYAFMPDELYRILEQSGASNIKLSGPGALSRSVPGEVLRNIINDEKLKKDFLDFCYEYDSNLHVSGMGKDNIVAIADV